MDRPAVGAAPRTMRYWLARTLRETRETAGLERNTVANLAGVDGATISRFENGHTWPQQIDRIVAAYALLCGVDDGRDLWARALTAYRTNGGAPLLGDLNPAQRALLLALEASQRSRPYDAESQEEPSATDRRQEDG